MANRGDDTNGHMEFELGDNLTSRFKILAKMGEGTFGRRATAAACWNVAGAVARISGVHGVRPLRCAIARRVSLLARCRVLECWDRLHREHVAVKIVRNVEKYRHAAMIEMEVLSTLKANDPVGAKHCISMREWVSGIAAFRPSTRLPTALASATLKAAAQGGCPLSYPPQIRPTPVPSSSSITVDTYAWCSTSSAHHSSTLSRGTTTRASLVSMCSSTRSRSSRRSLTCTSSPWCVSEALHPPVAPSFPCP